LYLWSLLGDTKYLWHKSLYGQPKVQAAAGVQGKIPYIFESNPHPNLICTSFCRFLKQKKLVHSSNPHIWEEDGKDKDDSDWVTDSDSVMSDDGESDEQ